MISKEEFIALFQQKITRRGADRLLEWMEKADFFTAPASTRFHLACKGGLMQHSVHVYQRLEKLCAAEYPDECPYSEETIAVTGLLHDLCKVNFYKEDTRNVKENGVWVQKPYYTVDEQIPYGHGEKSVYIVNGFIRLSREEAMAIRWHMGFSGTEDNRTVGQAFQKYPLAFALATADMEASYFFEEEPTV